MNQQKKKRSENWNTEEKNILREMILQSRHIIEDKSTKALSNIKKAQEWKNITHKLNKLMGKNRCDSEVKLAWKRMKLAAKANLSTHRQHQMQTGGGEKPKSPSQEDLAIKAIAPHDFAVVCEYGSDAVTIVVEIDPEEDVKAGSGTEFPPRRVPPDANVTQGASSVNGDTTTPTITPTPRKKIKIYRKKNPQNINQATQQEILKSNTEFKNRQLEMLEMEHQYNVKLAKLKIKKLELEIELLENRKNTRM